MTRIRKRKTGGKGLVANCHQSPIFFMDSETFYWAGCWIAAPTMAATANSKKKWVRVLGTLGILLTIPLWAIAVIPMLIGLSLDLYEMI